MQRKKWLPGATFCDSESKKHEKRVKKGTQNRPETGLFRLNATVSGVAFTLAGSAYLNKAGFRTISFAGICSNPKKMKKSSGRTVLARS